MHSRNLLKLLGLALLAAISIMAVSASAAQAKYLLLLNGASITTENLVVTQEGSGFITAENGLKIQCSGGSGTATVNAVEESKKVTGSASATFTGCVWVGSEATCTINDGGVGKIKAAGSGEVIMEGTNYLITATNAAFTTVLTEGAFCTIPEEEVVSGTAHVLVLNALADTTSKQGHLLTLSLKLGNSKVKELSSLVLVTDANPNATYGIHLVKLTGCEPIC
jgi:hypothetical protein